MKNKPFWLVIYLGLMIGSSFLKNFSGWTMNWQSYSLNWLLFAAGAVTGWYFIFFEKIWQVFYLYPANKGSVWVKEYLKAHRFTKIKAFLGYVISTDFSGTNRSIINSVLFHTAWIVIALFSLTSTTNRFGQGLVMGLGVYLVGELWQRSSSKDKSALQPVFYQLQRPLGIREARYYLYFFSTIMILISFLAI